jgi:cytochrome c
MTGRQWTGTAGLLLAVLAAPAVSCAEGDAVAGRQEYEARCSGCHAVDENRIGPAHRGVVGRRAGTAAGFVYSVAVKNSGVVWKADTLDAWLADPQELIPGQVMFFKVDDPAVRADIIAYLATLSR